jgi:hypothetical protein
MEKSMQPKISHKAKTNYIFYNMCRDLIIFMHFFPQNVGKCLCMFSNFNDLIVFFCMKCLMEKKNMQPKISHKA